MYWYLLTFFGGAMVGFLLAAILASAGCADRQIEGMMNKKGREQIPGLVCQGGATLNPKPLFLFVLTSIRSPFLLIPLL